MGKGLFTAGAAILLREACSIDDVVTAVGGFDVAGLNPASDRWEIGGPSVTLAYRPSANGVVLVDVVDKPWPDTMGDPDKEPVLFGAWSMGHFGPFAFPGGLERAGEQSWAWREGASVPARHTAFLRVRVSYVMGAADDAPVIPEDYDARAELLFVTEVCAALLRLDKAIAYFNPSGEVLLGSAALDESLMYGKHSGNAPLDAWTNIRLFGIDDRWKLMDTVGMSQLEAPDIEACFEVDRYNPGSVDQMLRAISLYLLHRGRVIKEGDTLPGAGGVSWRAMKPADPLSVPAREVLRFVPVDGTTPPESVTGGTVPPAERPS